MKFLKKLQHCIKETIICVSLVIFWYLSLMPIVGSIFGVVSLPFCCDIKPIIYLSFLLVEIGLIVLLVHNILNDKQKEARRIALCFWIFFILMLFTQETLYTNCNGFLWDPD